METVVCKITSAQEGRNELSLAGDVLRRGGLVAFPTETVYGLGASALSANAAERIYAAKGRPSDNPLIVHIAEPGEAEKYAYTTELYYKLAESFMPGPLTVIMPKKETIPDAVTGGLDTVALRCPKNEIARALIVTAGVPIAAPSANLSGSPSPTSASHVYDDLNGRIEMLIDGGECDIGVESTVISISDDIVTILRPGSVTEDMLRCVASDVRVDKAVVDIASVGAKPASPGMKYKHYSPSANVVLVDAESEDAFVAYVNDRAGEHDGVFASRADEARYRCHVLITGEVGSACELNHSLYALLREADERSLESLYIRKPPAWGEHLALFNRLIRAAAGNIVKI